MKRLLASCLAIAAALAVSVPPAPAATLYTNELGPGLHTCLSATAPSACNGPTGPSAGTLPLSLDVTGAGFASGSTITAATLRIALADDSGRGDGSEKIDIWLDTKSYVSHADANHDVVITFTDFTDLLDGGLAVLLGANTGDFFVEGAELDIWADPPAPPAPTGLPTGPDGPAPDPRSASVPAPAPLVLLSGSMAGLIWLRRRR